MGVEKDQEGDAISLFMFVILREASNLMRGSWLVVPVGSESEGALVIDVGNYKYT